jgi:ATP-dependent Clp protease protease subunit
MRVALTNARIMIHQPSGGAQGMASDIEIQAREILRIRHRMNELMAQYTGQTIEEIEKNVERDKFFSASEAKTFGWWMKFSTKGLLRPKRMRRKTLV